MHEWALAESVVLTAEKFAKEQGFSEIKKITIKLGDLQQIDKNIFRFAIKEMFGTQRLLLKNAKIKFQSEKAFLKCRKCGNAWTFARNVKKLKASNLEAIHFVPEAAHAYMHCSRCNSADFEIVQGRGVWLDSITGK